MLKCPDARCKVAEQDPIDQGRARHSPCSAKPVRYKDSASTPGETRTPNLLIRRSPSRVRGCPQPSTHAGTDGLRVHQRPWPSTQVHREWLPTWLPKARAQTVGCAPAALPDIDKLAHQRISGRLVRLFARRHGRLGQLSPDARARGQRVALAPSGLASALHRIPQVVALRVGARTGASGHLVTGLSRQHPTQERAHQGEGRCRSRQLRRVSWQSLPARASLMAEQRCGRLAVPPRGAYAMLPVPRA